LDVRFSEDGRRIEASRFLLQGYRIYDAVDETAMVEELRTICQQMSSDDFQVCNCILLSSVPGQDV
jgi:hypothetical protein